MIPSLVDIPALHNNSLEKPSEGQNKLPLKNKPYICPSIQHLLGSLSSAFLLEFKTTGLTMQTKQAKAILQLQQSATPLAPKIVRCPGLSVVTV